MPSHKEAVQNHIAGTLLSEIFQRSHLLHQYFFWLPSTLPCHSENLLFQIPRFVRKKKQKTETVERVVDKEAEENAKQEQIEDQLSQELEEILAQLTVIDMPDISF